MKRGGRGSISSQLLFILFNIILVVFVGAILFSYIAIKTTNTGYDSIVVSKDLGLLSSAIYGSPGNIVQEYSFPKKSTSSIKITMKDSVVNTYVNDTKSAWAYYLADGSKPMFQLYNFVYGDDLTFYRFGYDLSNSVHNYNKLSCPPTNYSVPDWKVSKKLFFETHSSNGKLIPLEKTIGEKIKFAISSKQLISLTDNINGADVSIALRISRSVDFGGIRVHIQENSSDSRILACSVINELLSKDTFVKFVQVVPITPQNKDLQNTKTDIPSIILEFGVLDESQIFSEPVANAIYNALSRFYGDISRLAIVGQTMSIDVNDLTSDSFDKTSSSCEKSDEKIIDFSFNDKILSASPSSRVWIPSQANCAGKYPLIILLHDSNAKSLYYGLNDEFDVKEFANELLSSGAKPFILSTPSNLVSNQKDLWVNFDLQSYVTKVKENLPSEIEISQTYVIAQGAAACNLEAGLYSIIKTGNPDLVIQSDSCMGEKYSSALSSFSNNFITIFLPEDDSWGSARSSESIKKPWDSQDEMLKINIPVACPNSIKEVQFSDCDISVDKKRKSIQVREFSSSNNFHQDILYLALEQAVYFNK